MKCIVVNADDLGYSPGVNQGIVVAHQRGVLTSASLMVDMPASRDGARLTRDLPALSVGLHANLADASGQPLVSLETGEGCGEVLQQQLDRFDELMGRLPTPSTRITTSTATPACSRTSSSWRRSTSCHYGSTHRCAIYPASTDSGVAVPTSNRSAPTA